MSRETVVARGGGGIDGTVNDFKVMSIVTLFRVGRLVY